MREQPRSQTLPDWTQAASLSLKLPYSVALETSGFPCDRLHGGTVNALRRVDYPMTLRLFQKAAEPDRTSNPRAANISN